LGEGTPETTKTFEDGVAAGAGRPVPVINAARFDPDLTQRMTAALAQAQSIDGIMQGAANDPVKASLTSDLAQEAKKQFTAQGITTPSGVSDMALAEAALKAATNGPQAIELKTADGTAIPIVTRPEMDAKAVMTSGLPASLGLKELPGTSADWDQVIAEHEGRHISQKTDRPNVMETTNELTREASSDSFAMQNLKAQGKLDMAEAMLDIRMLKVIHADGESADHATGYLIDPKDFSYRTPTDNDIGTLMSLKDTMIDAVAKQKGTGRDAATELLSTKPAEFSTTLKTAIAEGKVPKSEGPTTIEFMNKYMDAVERRIEASPAPQVAPSVAPTVAPTSPPPASDTRSQAPAQDDVAARGAALIADFLGNGTGIQRLSNISPVENTPAAGAVTYAPKTPAAAAP